MNKKNGIVLLGLLLSVSLAWAQAQNLDSADTKIILERRGCFGTCPAYKLTIYPDGKINFLGKEYVKAMGPHVKRISSDKLALIWRELENTKFFDLDGKYDCEDVTDQATTITTVIKDGSIKQIVHYQGCMSANKKELSALTKLEDKIDKLAGIDDWLLYEKRKKK
ncbi:MAG: hypothetical protein HQL26_04615 [Candidatus Omnitrophica bacterium]|nr:hypothetical protein [Candidatus Omnitrophota bacterium]